MVDGGLLNHKEFFLGSNLTGCYFLFSFFFRGRGCLILLFSSCLNFSFYLFFYYFFLIFFIPLTCMRHIYKTAVTTQTTVNSEIYANCVK